MEFWARQRELARLRAELDEVRTSGQGRMLAVRGRRQTGKSRLLTELVVTCGHSPCDRVGKMSTVVAALGGNEWTARVSGEVTVAASDANTEAGVRCTSARQRTQIEHEHVTRREIVELLAVLYLSPQDDPAPVGR